MFRYFSRLRLTVRLPGASLKEGSTESSSQSQGSGGREQAIRLSIFYNLSAKYLLLEGP